MCPENVLNIISYSDLLFLSVFCSLLENSSEPQAVRSDSHNCDVIMQRHVYDSLIVARKARNYMSAVAKCGNIIERKFALAGD